MGALAALCVGLTLLGTVASGLDLYNFPGEVFEIAVDSQTQSVYVGGMNTVYKLTTNLTLLRNTTLSRCERADGCGNRVRVLEIDRVFQRLLVCGTQEQCWLLGLQDLDKQLLSSPQGVFLPKGIQKPQMNLVGNQEPGKSAISRWMVASPNTVGEPILSVREISRDLSGEFMWRYSENGQENIITKNNSSFSFDLLDGFCFGEECFYLTLQQQNTSRHRKINRMASVCATSLFPYVENRITIDGEQSGDPLNSLLGFSVGRLGDKKDGVFVIMVFRKPVFPPRAGMMDGAKGFVVGVVQLQDLKQYVNDARRMCGEKIDFFRSNVQIPDWYKGKFVPCQQHQVQKERCPSGPVAYPVIQDKKNAIRVPSVAETDDDDIGEVTLIFTHTEPLKNETNGQDGLDDHMTIYVVTSTGRIFKFHALASGRGNGLNVQRLDSRLTGGHLNLSAVLRPDVGLSDQHFFLLSGSGVIRRPLDPCLGIRDCRQCTSVKGCGWCPQTLQCRLLARCKEDGCPPEIQKMEPTSGPVTGATTLTLHVLDVKTLNFNVSICQQPCRITDRPKRINKKDIVVKCRVPPSADGSRKECEVVIKFEDQRTKKAVAPDLFAYTVPELHDFTPARMLFTERGNLTFHGKHLDSGSDVSVRGNDEILCNVIGSRNTSQFRCEVPALQPSSRERCYNVTVTIDLVNLTWTARSASERPVTSLAQKRTGSAGEQNHPPDVFCRLTNPEISYVASKWTFRGGNVTVRVTGSRLDLAVVSLHLTVRGRQSNGGPCEVCHDVTDGTCLLCRTPDITSLTAISSDSADLGFEMRGRQSLERVGHNDTSGPIVMRVLPDPEFRLAMAENASCLVVNEHSELTIQGARVPGGKRYTVTVRGCPCGPSQLFPSPSTPFAATTSATTTTTTTASLSCSLQSVWPCLPRPVRSPTNAGSSSFPGCDDPGPGDSEGGASLCTWNVEVRIQGRGFLAGCLVPDPSPPGSGGGVKTEVVTGVAAGGTVVLMLVVLVLVCCCCVRYKKQQFHRRRQAHRHSAVSEGALLPSESGGSAEGRYVSLVRLLNPDGDPKKQKEIDASGIIIRRRYLDLGSVVGHGNFGCVFEGQYQREAGDGGSWQKVAVKTLINPATHAIDLKTFIDEAMLMKNFDHDHVLGLLGLSEGDHGPLVVLPFMDQGDILSYVKKDTTELTLGDILKFSSDIASGMDYLASSKFVHRDLAARNCMLDDDLRVKVADFGLCRDVYEKGYYHSDNRKKLPIRWMPPESIEKGTYTSKSDVWSMGVVMWEMLTRGIMPYPGVEGWDILRYLLAGRRLDQPALCPDAVYALMERCWRLDPLERPTFREIEHDLHSLTSALRDLSASCVTNVHLLTPITFPACHRFKDDEAIVAKVKEAMNQSTLNSYSGEVPTSAESGGAEGRKAGAVVLHIPADGQGATLAAGERAASPGELPPQQRARNVRQLSIPVPEESHADDRQSLELGPIVTCPKSPKDDGYFMLEQEAPTPSLTTLSSSAQRHSQGDVTDSASPARFLSPRSAGGGEEGGKNVDDDGAESVVSWKRLTELRTMAGKDDGYFELEREDATTV